MCFTDLSGNPIGKKLLVKVWLQILQKIVKLFDVKIHFIALQFKSNDLALTDSLSLQWKTILRYYFDNYLLHAVLRSNMCKQSKSIRPLVSLRSIAIIIQTLKKTLHQHV